MPRRSRSQPTLDALLTSSRGIKFNRRHYEVIAAALREYRAFGGVNLGADFRAEAVDDIAGVLADAFERDNPFFSRARFLEAVAEDATHE